MKSLVIYSYFKSKAKNHIKIRNIYGTKKSGKHPVFSNLNNKISVIYMCEFYMKICVQLLYNK